jgi:hypothetical protein
MDVATLVFSAIAAVGTVMAVWVASGPLRQLIESKHRKLDAVTADYAEMFGRLYRFVMDDLNDTSHVKPENAKIFTEIAGNEMYLHCGSEAEAWQRYRQTHKI